MSWDIAEGTDHGAAHAASEVVGDILYETGVNAGDAYTDGTKAAQYGGEVVFLTLREMGLLSTEINLEEFRVALTAIRAIVLPRGTERRIAEPTAWGSTYRR